MYEYGCVWEIVGDDGTTVVFNDGTSGLYLEEISGFDSPNVRPNVEDLPEWDGAKAGDFFYGQRPVTLSGKVGVNMTASQRNAVMVNLQRALRGLRADATLKSEPSGLPAMQIGARVTGVRFSGALVKGFQIQAICADPRIVGQTENQENDPWSAGSGDPGASFDLAFPIVFGGGTADPPATVLCTNAGNFDAVPVVKVYGPLTSVEVYNGSTGQTIYVDNLTLVSGEWVEIDMGARTVVKSDGASYYDRVRFPGSEWWLLPPGSTSVEINGTGFAAQTELEVRWRDTWC